VKSGEGVNGECVCVNDNKRECVNA
jgi:hypothetical protein